MQIADYKNDLDYISSRLCSTYVIHNEAFEYVLGVRGDGLEVDEREEIIPFDEVDINPRPLGYFSYGGKLCYISRSSARHYKQGYCPENVLISGGYKPAFNKLFRSKKVASQLLGGRYPLPKFEEDVPSRFPLSRNFAAKDNNLLCFREIEVGTWDHTPLFGLVTKLDEEYKFLDQMLEGEVYAQF